jgi:uncharacterized phosphosugar-binding protein
MTTKRNYGREYMDQVVDYYELVEKTERENIAAAAKLMAEAIAEDRLIHVYGGGGHTCLVMAELFFRAGGLACINPIMDVAVSPFNQSLKYLEIERTVNYGRSVVRYYDIAPGDVFVIFHNIGVNPATIDAAMEAKERGARIIAVSSKHWQEELPQDHFIRHPSGENVFDFAEVCIDDHNPVGDATLRVDGFDTPIAPPSNLVDFYIAHRLEIETVRKLVEMGVEPPVWRSANAPGGDEFNAKYVEKYKPRVKNL